MLRDFLPFSQPVASKKASDSARSLLDALSDLPPLETASRLTLQVIPSIVKQENHHMRFKLLDEARLNAERALPILESQVMAAILPLPMSATSAAVHADNLLKSLAIAYAGVARGIGGVNADAGNNPLFYRGVQRAMSLVTRRQLLAYRAYATPSAASWKMLHELYQMACAPSSKPIDGETAPIEHEYLGALLLAYLEPGKLPHNELETIHACTRKLAAYAVLNPTPSTAQKNAVECCFLVRQNEASPGLALANLAPETPLAGGLLIDCTQVLAAIDRNLTRAPGKSVQPDLSAPPYLLQSLRVAIGGKSARRYSRSRFRPRADLIFGLEAVITFVDGNVYTRRSLDSAGRQTTREMISSEWSLVDESPDGFKVRFIKGETTKITAGELVALQPRESSKTHICLVRRITSAATRLELGLQLLSPQVSAVTVKGDAQAATQAIFLHSVPAFGKFSALITAPGKFQIGQTVHFQTFGQTLHRQIGKCIESSEGLEIVALDPLPN